MANLFKGVQNWVAKTYSADASKMLLHLGTLGWVLSAIAQVCAIVNNDKVTAKEKKFLIPQEIADAAINITSFYVVTLGIQNFARKLVGAGIITKKPILDFCKKYGLKTGKWSTDVGKFISTTVEKNKTAVEVGGKNLTEEGQNACKATINDLNEFNDKVYEPFESGVKMIGNAVGAVLSSNIITPLLRNPIAAMRQKTAIAESMHATNPLVQPVQVNYNNKPQVNKPQMTTSANLLNTYKSGSLKI